MSLASARKRCASSARRRSVTSVCVPQALTRRPFSTTPVRLFRIRLRLPSRSTSSDSASVSRWPERMNASRYSTFSGTDRGMKSPRRAPTISSARVNPYILAITSLHSAR
jgi:hypothetical protein